MAMGLRVSAIAVADLVRGKACIARPSIATATRYALMACWPTHLAGQCDVLVARAGLVVSPGRCSETTNFGAASGTTT